MKSINKELEWTLKGHTSYVHTKTHLSETLISDVLYDVMGPPETEAFDHPTPSHTHTESIWTSRQLLLGVVGKRPVCLEQ